MLSQNDEEGVMRLSNASIAAVAAVLSGAGFSTAANSMDEPNPPLAQIKCGDFRKLPDGTYLSSPTARFGSLDFANQSVGPAGYNFGNGNLYNLIAQKCGNSVKLCRGNPCW
jgi:hypothetical protein